MVATSTVKGEEYVCLDKVLERHRRRILLGRHDQSGIWQDIKDAVKHSEFLHESNLGRANRLLEISQTCVGLDRGMVPLTIAVAALVVDVRIGLAECTAPTVATTALLALTVITSADLEPLLDKPLELWIILIVIDLNDVREIRSITIVALTEGAVWDQIAVRVVLVYGDVLTGPLSLMDIAAETVDPVMLALGVLESSLG